MNAILRVQGVNKSYGAHHVLKSISLEVNEGETFALIGPNGAGKTTLFKVMTGEVFCESGKLEYAGKDITQTAAHTRVVLGMGRTFQIARIFPDVSARDNLIVAIEARRRARNEAPAPWYRVKPSATTIREAEQRLHDVGLLDTRDIEAKFLSHGDKKRLEIGIALAGNPKILMLDEPTAGMSPSDRIATSELLLKLRTDTGVTIVMTEHDMDVIY